MARVSGDLRILKEVDSTNNYAMGLVKSGEAYHGLGILALEQSSGKGQRGRIWESSPGENLLFTMLSEMSWVAVFDPFKISVATAVSLWETVSGIVKEPIFLKWPNDLYINDRKAAGVLIENIVVGQKWQWSIIGVGLNVNQQLFSPGLKAISLRNLTGNQYEIEVIGKTLQERLLENIQSLKNGRFPDLLRKFNDHLYMKDRQVKFRKGNITFVSMVRYVNASGELVTQDAFERHLRFGEVDWVSPDAD